MGVGAVAVARETKLLIEPNEQIIGDTTMRLYDVVPKKNPALITGQRVKLLNGYRVRELVANLRLTSRPRFRQSLMLYHRFPRRHPTSLFFVLGGNRRCPHDGT